MAAPYQKVVGSQTTCEWVCNTRFAKETHNESVPHPVRSGCRAGLRLEQRQLKDGAGANVSGATVAVRNASVADGVVNLTEVTGTPGRYTATLASFPSGDFQLSVVKGTDSVLGVVVGGPGMHTITAPALNATVTAGQPLDVTWSTPAVAKQVSVTTRDMSITAPDTGVYSLTAAQNPARLNQRVTVVRTNEVEAAGGLLGSRVNVTYTAQINPYNVQ